MKKQVFVTKIQHERTATTFTVLIDPNEEILQWFDCTRLIKDAYSKEPKAVFEKALFIKIPPDKLKVKLVSIRPVWELSIYSDIEDNAAADSLFSKHTKRLMALAQTVYDSRALLSMKRTRLLHHNI